MMATFVAMLAPRAVGVRRADQGGARHPVVGGHGRRPRSPNCPGAARSSCATSGSTTPAPSDRCCATSRSSPAPARPPRSSAAPARARPRCSTSCPACSTPPPAGAGRRRRRARHRARAAVEPHRPGSPEAVPVLRHRRQQPALRRPGRHRRRAVGRRSTSPRPPTSSGPCPKVSSRRSPRAARTCPAVSASGWPSPGRWCASPGSTCSTTRSRPSTSRPTPACAPRWRRSPPTPRW